MARFYPKNHQYQFTKDQLIQPAPPENDDQVPMDVVFVGGGPCGLAGAIELARLVKKDAESGGNLGSIEIGVLEKSESLGGACLSGAVINPRALQELFPEKALSDFPFQKPVAGDQVYFLTENGKMRIPTPPTMHNKGNYVASICEVVQWMGAQAEELGVNLLTGFPAESLLTQENRVVGVRTGAVGLNRDGQPGPQHMPPTDVMAQVTVLTEGTRGLLTQGYLDWQKITSPSPQIYALGVKELWKVKKPLTHVTHTMGWPLPRDAFGGSFIYPMGEDLVSIGLVVGLDYRQANLDVHDLLQDLKAHPVLFDLLNGGEVVEWGAKTIPEGGLNAIPERLHGDGLLMAGDCVGFVNVPALKGIHYAIQSGIYAARAIFKGLKNKNTSADSLKAYDQMVKDSYIWSDLKAVRNMRQAFKSGFFTGGMKASLMSLTGGNFPGVSGESLEDSAEWKEFITDKPSEKTGKIKRLSKVDAVYLSGNKTRDDIPSHLRVGENVGGELADFYSHMCPAGVYERQGDQLVVNAPNCIDCKATDVLGPRWTPREGGSGPNYKKM